MNDLPPDLLDHGWKLLTRAPDRHFAVSIAWGGTVVSATIEEVIKNARYMTRYIEWRNEQEHCRRTTSQDLHNGRTDTSA